MQVKILSTTNSTVINDAIDELEDRGWTVIDVTFIVYGNSAKSCIKYRR